MVYIYIEGAENTKSQHQIKCKVQNFNNIQPDLANKEQQQKKLSKFQKISTKSQFEFRASHTIQNR